MCNYRWLFVVGLGFSLLFTATFAGAASAGPLPFQDFLIGHYTAPERSCEQLSDIDRGGCFAAAYRRRDSAIASLVKKAGGRDAVAYQAAWLKWRAGICEQLGAGGSGQATISAQCKLDFSIVRQLELQYADDLN